MKFSDLVFKQHPFWVHGKQAEAVFPNGYTASVITTANTAGGSYGGEDGLYELAVINTATNTLVYDTPITNDVEGWLTEDNVTDLLARIEALPMRV